VGAGPLLASPLPTTAGHTAQPAGAAQATAGQPDRASPPLRLPAPPLAPPAARPEALENIARQADQQLYHGFELANRQAYFAARSEFIAALRLVAQGLDAHERTGAHSQSLAAGLTALKEAQDFMPADARLEAELDLPAIVGGHRTPVLKAVPPGQLQALAAVAAYLTFAQERLAAAAGREVAGSMALSALGKLHAALAGQNTPGLQAPEPKAVAFFQAALLVYPRNCIAANELGVLLARNGDYAHARRALEHSVSVGRTALGLRNLALVYRRLGQPQLAELAGRQAEGLAAAEAAAHREFRGSPAGAVRWVEPEVMARTAGQAATR
jgi:tetratricopeptide (TPR) repeat protein